MHCVAAGDLAAVPPRHSRLPAERPALVALPTSCGRSSSTARSNRRAQDHRPRRSAALAGSTRGHRTCAQEYADACAWRAHERAVRGPGPRRTPRAEHELAACATLDDVLVAARRLADDIPGHGSASRSPATAPSALDRRAADERIHRRARARCDSMDPPATQPSDLAVAVARRAARLAHRTLET